MAINLAYLIWLLVSLHNFYSKDIRNAILNTILLGWLFLPSHIPAKKYIADIQGLPNLDKKVIIIAIVCFLIILKEMKSRTIRKKFRLSLCDALMLLYLVSPIITNFYQSIGFREGFSEFRFKSIDVGLPYLIGRIFFSNINNHILIAKKFLYFAFLYIPLFLYEFRFSPQLNNIIFAYHQHDFKQSTRNIGWRPLVFLDHGLEVAITFSFLSIIGFWLIRSRIMSKSYEIIGISCLLLCSFLSQSLGALSILALGMFTLLASRYFKAGFLIVILFAFPTFYISTKVLNYKIEQPIIETVREILPLKRFRSVNFRLEQEYRFIESLEKNKILGKGRIKYLDGLEHTKIVRDSRWIIEYSNGGLLSLISFFLILTFPIFGLYRMAPANLWHTAKFSSTAALSVGVALFSWDFLFNNFVHLIYFLILGALVYPYYEKEKFYYRIKSITKS